MKNPLALTPLLTIGDVHQPAHEPVEATFALQGSRHHFHIKRDSDPDQSNGCVCFDCRWLEDGHRTVHFRQGDTATITVGITWEKFETPVELKFTKSPRGSVSESTTRPSPRKPTSR